MAWTDYYVSSLASGGGAGSEASPWTISEAVTNMSPGDRINVKADGQYLFNSGVAFDTSGTDGTLNTPIWWRGYSSTPGDSGMAQIRGTGQQYVALVKSGNYQIFSNFDVEKGDLNGIWSTSNVILYRCRVVNTSTAATATLVVSPGIRMAVGCFFKSAGGLGSQVMVTGQGHVLLNCVVDSYGILNSNASNTSQQHTTRNNVIICRSTTYPAMTVGMYSHKTDISNNRIYGGSVGIDLASSQYDFKLLQGNVIYGATTGIKIDSMTSGAGNVILADNAIGGATTAYDVGDAVNIDPITLTADPFTDPTNLDFSLNDVAGGGALLKTQWVTPVGNAVNANQYIFNQFFAGGSGSTSGVPKAVWGGDWR